MKKKLFCFMLVFGIIASIVTLLPTSALATAEGTCGENLTWTLDDEGTLTISGSGEMNIFSSFNSAPWYSYRSNIKEVIISDEVTRISKYAFCGCSSLTSITIPDSVAYIGEGAFGSCSSLTSITIPDSVAYIGEGAFGSCSSLESITLPFIGNSRNASSYSAVFGYIFGYSSTNYIGDSGDSTTQQFSSTYYTYKVPSSLKTVTITDTEKIPYGAFYGYRNLTNIVLPDNVTSVGTHAFYNCSSLTSITIPNGVTTINEGTFYGCSSLTNITLPFIGSSRTTNGSFGSVFGYIFGISTSSSSITTTQYYSSNNSRYYYIPSSLRRVTITDAEQIPYGAFYGCKNLTNITLTNSITSISDCAFAGCSSLTSITLPFIGSSQNANGTSDAVFGYLFGNSSFTDATCTTQYYSSSDSTTYYIPSSLKTVNIANEENIPYGAFSGCAGIENISLNSDISTVSAKAFSGCNSLLKVDMLSKNAKFAKSNIFEDCDFVSLYGYSDSTAEAYADTYGIDFVAYSSEGDNGDDSTGTDTDTDADSNVTINASCYIDDNKIILSLCFDKFISNKEVICGFYDESGVLIDLHTVPVAISTNCVYVSIPDDSRITTVKTMIWNSLEEPNPASLVNPITVTR